MWLRWSFSGTEYIILKLQKPKMWLTIGVVVYVCVLLALRRCRMVRDDRARAPFLPRTPGAGAAFPSHVRMRGFASAAFQESGGYASDAVVGSTLVHLPGVETDWTWRAAEGPPPEWAAGLLPVHFSKGNGAEARLDEDLRRMREAGANTYRFSLCWAKLQARPRGALRQAAVAALNAKIERVRAHGLTPMLTLFHFVLPRWFPGWHADGALDLFADFARRVALLVRPCADADGREWWITINEPSIATVHGYVVGTRPPGIRDVRLALRAYTNMLRAHVVSATLLRQRAAEVHASFAWNVSCFDPAHRWWLGDELLATALDSLFNRAALHLLTRGGAWVGAQYVAGEAWVPQPVFVAVNTYTRLRARTWPALDVDHEAGGKECVPNDLRWDLSARHLATVLHSIHAACPHANVVITEHGIPDEGDADRRRLLRETSRVLAAAPFVSGYLHWCFTRNHEWDLAPKGNFGVVNVDFANDFARTPRESYYLLKRLWTTR